MKILQDKENNTIGRKELVVELEKESSPNYVEITEMISENLKADKELVIVKKIKSSFGKNIFEIQAFVYKNKESKEKFERKKEKKKEAVQTAQK